MSEQKIDIPSQVEKEIFISIGVGKYNVNHVYISDFDKTKHNSAGFEAVLLKTQKIKVDLSDADIKDLAGIKRELVQQLQEQQQTIQAEAHRSVQSIQHKIDNLLCIEHQKH